MNNNYQYPIQTVPNTPLARPGEFRFTDFPISDERDTFHQYWKILRRHVWLILALFVAAEAVTLLFLARTPRLYTSSSTISIEPQAPDVMSRDNKNTSEDTVNDPAFYTTEWEVLKSRTLAARVIRDLKLAHDQSFMGEPEEPSLVSRMLSWIRSTPAVTWLLSWSPLKAHESRSLSTGIGNDDILGVSSGLIDEYLSGLTIRPEYETRLVEVSYTSIDPVLAARLANAHVQAYIEQGYDMRTRSNANAQRFLESQLGQLEHRLEKSEAALNQYRQERGIVAFALDDKDRLVSERIAEINKDMVEAQERRIGLQAEVETIKNNDYEAIPEVVNNSLIQNLKAELSRLQGQYANLSNEYTKDYPEVSRLEAQIDQVQRHERHEIERVVASIKGQYNTALDREDALNRQLEQEKSRAMSLNNASLRDAVLVREVDTNRELYRDVLERFKLLGVASEARISNVSIVDTATVSHYPSSPKKKLSLVLAGFLSVLAGISLAFLIDMWDKGLKTADELEQFLRLPVLASVLRFSGKVERKLISDWSPARLVSSRGNAEEINGVRQLADNRDFVRPANNGNGSAEKAFSASVEAYRTIRTRILLSRPDSPPKTILFTSPISGEGKTAIAVNTAVAFASLHERVLLIDGDLRRGRCHEIMNRRASPGLTEVLSGLSPVEDAIQPTAVNGLFVLCAGASSPNPSELLGSKKMAELFGYLASRYRYVLVDSAPVLPVSDSVLLSTLVDAVVLVAGRHTPRQIVRLGCGRLACIGARIIGAVLNSVELEHEPYYTHYMRY
jgi:capsular exopolysaccharide synthesis family protein